MFEDDPGGNVFLLPRPVTEVAAWFKRLDRGDLRVTVDPSEADEWVVHIHEQWPGRGGISNLAEIRLQATYGESTQVVVSAPPEPGPGEVLRWAYPQILAGELQEFIHGESEQLLLQAAGLSGLFLVDQDGDDDGIEFLSDGGFAFEEYEDEADEEDRRDIQSYIDGLAEYLKAQATLSAVDWENIIEPVGWRQTAAGDTWQTLARDFYGDEGYAQQMADVMAEYGMDRLDLDPGSYLPQVCLFKTPQPGLRASAIQHALDHIRQLGMVYGASHQWLPVMAIFGLSHDHMLDILGRVYQTAVSIK